MTPTNKLIERLRVRIQHYTGCRFNMIAYGNLPGETCTCGRDQLIAELEAATTLSKVASSDAPARPDAWHEGVEAAAEQIAEAACSSANIVTCDGYYEFDLGAATKAVATAIRALTPPETTP